MSYSLLMIPLMPCSIIALCVSALKPMLPRAAQNATLAAMVELAKLLGIAE